MELPFTLVVDGKLIDYYHTYQGALGKASNLLKKGASIANIHNEVSTDKVEVVYDKTKDRLIQTFNRGE